MPQYSRLKGSALLVNQVTAMFMKKALYVLRTWYISLIQILMPTFFLTLTIIIVKTWETIPDLPPLTIDMKVRYKFR
jgi:ATP-binding cassette subfamily A (ABC1) protein 3